MVAWKLLAKSARAVAGRACRPWGVTDDDVEAAGEILRHLSGRRALHRLPAWPGCQPAHDLLRIAGVREALSLRGIAQHVGQIGQNLQVLVRACGDAHDQMHPLTGVPFHACGDLQYRYAGFPNQIAVLGHAVWDSDAVAEKGIGHPFPRQHAVGIGRCDAAGIDQELGHLADRIGLVGRACGYANCGGIESDHGFLT
jgi:hypothetical protein